MESNTNIAQIFTQAINSINTSFTDTIKEMERQLAAEMEKMNTKINVLEEKQDVVDTNVDALLTNDADNAKQIEIISEVNSGTVTNINVLQSKMESTDVKVQELNEKLANAELKMNQQEEKICLMNEKLFEIEETNNKFKLCQLINEQAEIIRNLKDMLTWTQKEQYARDTVLYTKFNDLEKHVEKECTSILKATDTVVKGLYNRIFTIETIYEDDEETYGKKELNPANSIEYIKTITIEKSLDASFKDVEPALENQKTEKIETTIVDDNVKNEEDQTIVRIILEQCKSVKENLIALKSSNLEEDFLTMWCKIVPEEYHFGMKNNDIEKIFEALLWSGINIETLCDGVISIQGEKEDENSTIKLELKNEKYFGVQNHSCALLETLLSSVMETVPTPAVQDRTKQLILEAKKRSTMRDMLMKGFVKESAIKNIMIPDGEDVELDAMTASILKVIQDEEAILIEEITKLKNIPLDIKPDTKTDCPTEWVIEFAEKVSKKHSNEILESKHSCSRLAINLNDLSIMEKRNQIKILNTPLYVIYRNARNYNIYIDFPWMVKKPKNLDFGLLDIDSLKKNVPKPIPKVFKITQDNLHLITKLAAVDKKISCVPICDDVIEVSFDANVKGITTLVKICAKQTYNNIDVLGHVLDFKLRDGEMYDVFGIYHSMFGYKAQPVRFMYRNKPQIIITPLLHLSDVPIITNYEKEFVSLTSTDIENYEDVDQQCIKRMSELLKYKNGRYSKVLPGPYFKNRKVFGELTDEGDNYVMSCLEYAQNKKSLLTRVVFTTENQIPDYEEEIDINEFETFLIPELFNCLSVSPVIVKPFRCSTCRKHFWCDKLPRICQAYNSDVRTEDLFYAMSVQTKNGKRFDFNDLQSIMKELALPMETEKALLFGAS